MRHLRQLSAVLGLGLLALGAVACGGRGEAPDTIIEQEPTASAHVFKVRAEVMRVPADASPEIYLHHEAIEGFVDPRGKVVGMDPMTMPFPLAKTSLAKGLSAGDKVMMTLVIDWPAPHPVLVTSLEPLPPETPLDFKPLPRDENELDEAGTSPAP